MASFSECWGQLKAKGYKHANGKEVLTDNDKQSILDRTEMYKKEDGLSHGEAIRKSIQEHHDEAHAQVQSIHEQVFGKQEPVAQTGAVGIGDGKPSKIVASAIKNESTGEVYTGVSHPEIYARFDESELQGVPKDAAPFTSPGGGFDSPQGLIDGFVDENGKFYNRDEALTQSKKTKQYTPEYKSEGKLEAVSFNRQQRERQLRGETAPYLGEYETTKEIPNTVSTISTGETEPSITSPKTTASTTGSGIQKETGVGATKEEAPTTTGVSSKQFTEAYGDSAPVANTGKGPAEWSAEGMSRLDNFQKTGDIRDDPYSVLTNLREGRTPARQVASDTALLGAEHQRLLEAARQAEGTPEWGNKSQAALDMANAIKEVSHGTFADVGMALQEHNKPRYDNVTDFDQALREREKRESTDTEKTAFKKMAKDVESTRDIAAKEIDTAQKKLNKFPKMAFDDAAKSIRDQFSELTKNCGL